MDRKQWFQIHSWVGIKLSLLMCFILITGTFATVSKEIDWLFNPAIRIDVSESTGHYQWPQLYQNIRDAYPNAQLLSISVPSDPWFAVEAIALNQDGNRFRIYLHPRTNEVTGQGRWYNWQRFFRQSHRRLMLPVPVGVTIVGFFALLLIISLVTGIVSYRGWSKVFFKWPGRKSGSNVSGNRPRRYWGDMHKLLGVWSLWFIVVIAGTGIWYLLEQWGLAAQFPASSLPSSNKPKMISTDYDVDVDVDVGVERLKRIVESAEKHYPQLTIKTVLLPQRPGDPLLLRGQAEAILVRDRANQLSYDAASSKLIAIRRGNELSAHVRISEAADPLHFGYFAHAASRGVWFLFGVILSLLAVIGTYLYALRTLRSKHTAMTSNLWAKSWEGMGYLKLPSMLLIVACFVVTTYLFIL